MEKQTKSIQENANAEAVIEIQHLKKSFGSNEVLKDFNLTIKKGENVVIMGKSGCGKSVLIKLAVGLIKYDSGSLKIFGKEINSLSNHELDELRARIGFVFQSSALYDSMTIRENLEFSLRRHGRNKTKEEIQTLVEETLTNVGLLNTMDLMPSELSGGMRKRIGLARSFILHPEIMLYDEPTTGLDPITSNEIILVMLDMQKKYNMTSIIISHDVHCTKQVANRICVLMDGINYKEGTYDELKNSLDHRINSFFK
jgi:phospholipid/cholesterol/gamma-HCH transport system ATP-binding protein